MFLETCKRVSASGNSLTLNLTKELRQLGLDRGDAVKVTLQVPEAEGSTEKTKEILETMGGAWIVMSKEAMRFRVGDDDETHVVPIWPMDGPALGSALRACADGRLPRAVGVGGVIVTPVADEFEGVATEVTADGATFRLTYEEAVWLADRLGGDEGTYVMLREEGDE